jgi:enterochelin esterase-like enzyme
VGQVDVTSAGFVAVLGAAVLLAWWRVARGRSSRLHRTALAGALLLSALLVGDGVNSYFSDLPHLSDVVSVVTGPDSLARLDRGDLLAANVAQTSLEFPHGGVVRLAVPDRGSGFGPSTALVYLPPQYFAEPLRHFPVVYLLHGSPGSPGDWIRGGGASRTGSALAADGQPAVIVMPRMSHHWLDDPECVDGIHVRAETHLLQDVLPAAESAYRTLPGGVDRIIAGMSAGGFCALNLGLRHPDTFGTIIDMSGLDRPTHAGGTAALFGPGPQGDAAEAANDPSRYAAGLPDHLPVRIWMDAGRSDHDVIPGLVRLQTVLRSRGIDVRLRIRPGRHTYHVWRPALRQALQWALPPPPSAEPMGESSAQLSRASP